MKKITLTLMAVLAITAVSAQNEITSAGIGLDAPVSSVDRDIELAPCSQGNDGFDINGAAGSNPDNGFISAVDIIIPAGEFFTLESVSNFNALTLSGFLPTTVTVTYFEDGGDGFPTNTEIGSEAELPITINSSAPWVNPAADIHNLDFDVTPITFNGDPDEETRVWIGIQVSNNDAAGGPSFIEIRQDDAGGGTDALVGEPVVQRDPATLEWAYIDFDAGDGPEDDSEGFYTLNGDCDALLNVNENALSDLSIYPNPTNTGNVTISSRLAGDMNVLVFDILGKQVLNTVTTGDINVSSLKAGVYMVQVVQEGAQVTKKLVVR